MAKRDQVLEAVQAIGRPCSVAEITAWLEKHRRGPVWSDVRNNLSALTINDRNRRHNGDKRGNVAPDPSDPRDALIRVEVRGGEDVRYWLYDFATGGPAPYAEHEDLGAAEQALAEARADVYSEPLPDFAGESEARRYEMRAISLREGQPQFKGALLDAYAGKCAVTGCAVQAILEGAHIRPYSSGGTATNIVPNGLLLRSDIHTLFDRGLLWVDADGFVQLSSELDGSEYTPLRGRKLRLPEQPADHPHPDHLAHHRVHTARQIS